MSAERSVLTARLVARRRVYRVLVVVVAALWILSAWRLADWWGSGEPLPLLSIALPLWGALLLALSNQDPRVLTVSSTRMTWRGPGWRRTLRWSDVDAIGLAAPSRWWRENALVVRLTPEARPPAIWVYPLRVGLRRRGPQARAIVARLSRSGARGAWDVPDAELILAVKRHAADRWVDDLTPSD